MHFQRIQHNATTFLECSSNIECDRSIKKKVPWDSGKKEMELAVKILLWKNKGLRIWNYVNYSTKNSHTWTAYTASKDNQAISRNDQKMIQLGKPCRMVNSKMLKLSNSYSTSTTVEIWLQLLHIKIEANKPLIWT